jgi:hypothetical protein
MTCYVVTLPTPMGVAYTALLGWNRGLNYTYTYYYSPAVLYTASGCVLKVCGLIPFWA